MKTKTLFTLSALIMSIYADDDAKCNDREILSEGKCQSCPTWTRAQNNNTYCNSDKCDHNSQVVQTDGTCDSCPEGYEPDVNMVDCNKIGLECDGNTAKSGDECQECPMYTKPQSNNSYCSPDFCNDKEIILPNGSCQECDEGSKPDLVWRRECVVAKRNQVCDDRQIELKDHAGLTTCQDCPDFTRAQMQNWYCAADACDFNQVTQKDGSCLSCPKGQTPDASRLKCKPMPSGLSGPPAAEESAPEAEETPAIVSSSGCDLSWQLELEDGSCAACPEFTRPQKNGQCAPDMCSRSEFLHEWGYCLPCPDGMVHDQSGRACENSGGNLLAGLDIATCSEREHRSIDGTECFQCPDYTRGQDKNTKCAGDKCEIFQIQNVDGTCQDCPNDTRPNFMQRNCVEIVRHTACTHRQIYVEVMNMCEDCPDFTRPRGDYCAADKCLDNQRLMSDGTCSAVQCQELEILSSDGVTCEKCFPYTRPQENGTRCGQDDCPKGIIQYDGTCQEYGEVYANLKAVKSDDGMKMGLEKEEETSAAPMVVIGLLSVVILVLVGFIAFKFSSTGKSNSQNYNVSEVETARTNAQSQSGPTGKKLTGDDEFDKIDAEVPQEHAKDSIQAPIAANE